jgi:hypothetical protein
MVRRLRGASAPLSIKIPPLRQGKSERGIKGVRYKNHCFPITIIVCVYTNTNLSWYIKNPFTIIILPVKKPL